MDSPILQQIFNISTKKVLFENKKFLHYLSYTNEDFHHLNEKEFFESKLLFNKKAIIKREYYNRPVEFSILDKGNKENWFFCESKPLTIDKNNNPIIVYHTAINITQRKMNEQKVLEQQKLIQNMSQSIPEYIYLYDVLRDKILTSNRNCKELLGFPEQEFEDMNKTSYVHPDFIGGYITHRKKILISKKQKNFEYILKLKHKTKSYRWYKKKITIFQRDENNKPIKLLMKIEDIDKLKSNEILLKENEHFINEVTKNLPSTIHIIDIKENKLKYCNYEKTNILGYSKNEWMRTNGKVIHKDFYDKALKNTIKITNSKTNRTITDEYLIRNKNQQYRWYRSKIKAFKKDENGKTFQLLEIIEDIHDEKTNHNLVTDQKFFIEEIASKLPSNVYVISFLNHQIVYSNVVKKNILGYTNDEFIRNYNDIIHPDHFEMALKLATNVRNDNFKKKIEYDLLLMHKNKGYRWYRIRTKPFKRDASGKLTHVIDIIEDIHESKVLYNDLKTQLNKNKELERFASITSHDLKEPLRTIGNYSQILNKNFKDKFDKESLILLENIDNSTKRMSQLVEDILSYAKIETEGKKFELVDLNKLVKSVLKELEGIIKKKNTKIKVPSNLPKVSVDGIQMFQVFQNLISNAIKFSKDNHCKIEITFSQETTKYVFGVTDHGIGIAKKNLDKIFGIFRKLHKKDEYAGQGIGLSICKRIIDRHDGEIWVESEINKKTTFYFTLNK